MNDLLKRADIEDILPHRDPFLFVDRVIEMDGGNHILAARLFREDEPIFKGHFPGNPVVPGVVLIEALAQAAGIMAYRATDQTYKDCGAVLLRVDRMSFRRLVRPGDEVILDVSVRHRRDPVWRCECKATVGEQVCADGEITATFTKSGAKVPDANN